MTTTRGPPVSGDATREQVRHAILRAGHTPRSFADEADLDPGTLYDFLSGKRDGSSMTRYKIETALRWPVGSIDQLFAGLSFEQATTLAAGLEERTPVPARPVGLGLDDAAADLTDDDIEDIRALIRAKRERRGLT